MKKTLANYIRVALMLISCVVVTICISMLDTEKLPKEFYIVLGLCMAYIGLYLYANRERLCK